MFGFGKAKQSDVRLTEKEIKKLTSTMTRSERKEFERRQKQAKADREWDMLIMADMLDDEDEW